MACWGSGGWHWFARAGTGLFSTPTGGPGLARRDRCQYSELSRLSGALPTKNVFRRKSTCAKTQRRSSDRFGHPLIHINAFEGQLTQELAARGLLVMPSS